MKFKNIKNIQKKFKQRVKNSYNYLLYMLFIYNNSLFLLFLGVRYGN